MDAIEALFSNEPYQAEPPSNAGNNPVSASKPPQGVPSRIKPVDMPSSEPPAHPVQFLSLQAVAMGAIEKVESNPAIRQRLKAQYSRTLQAYHWMRDPDERQQTALNYLDGWLEDGYSLRISLDGTSDDAGAFKVTSWRLIPCSKPQTATPDAPAHVKATITTSTLPGMERRAI